MPSKVFPEGMASEAGGAGEQRGDLPVRPEAHRAKWRKKVKGGTLCKAWKV